jgi:hypothetical protein
MFFNSLIILPLDAISYNLSHRERHGFNDEKLPIRPADKCYNF